jgi:hypothetical protein
VELCKKMQSDGAKVDFVRSEFEEVGMHFAGDLHCIDPGTINFSS